MYNYDEKFYAGTWRAALFAAGIYLPFVKELITPNAVLDIGCGLGNWLYVCQKLGISDILGIDGHNLQEKLLISPDNYISKDLEKKLEIGKTFDLAMCIEVAEHLSPERAESFVSELCTVGRCILFSAAIPGQGGTNHLNEQYPSYWIKLFAERGFKCFDVIRPRYWADRQIIFYLRQNMMLFVDEKAGEICQKLSLLPSFHGTDLVLPELFEMRAPRRM